MAFNKANETEEVYENSKPIMASYGFVQFFSRWITCPFSLLVFSFYKAEITFLAHPRCSKEASSVNKSEASVISF
ncbi:MAG: hypothetical protein ACW964_11540 [Candidatus Hodarchaeales archaeon]